MYFLYEVDTFTPLTHRSFRYYTIFTRFSLYRLNNLRLHPDYLDALKYPTFWEETRNPSLKKFLDFRHLENDLEDSDTEHYGYQCELNTISKYYTEKSEVECLHGLLCGWYACKGKVECSVRSSFWVECSYGQPCGWDAREEKGGMLEDKKSRSVKLFWDKQDICSESELLNEKSKLQWKEGMVEFEKTGLIHLQKASSAVQEKQILSYTSYKKSTTQTNNVCNKADFHTPEKKHGLETEENDEEHNANLKIVETPHRIPVEEEPAKNKTGIL
ncbi:hypothetical protein Glove_330g50 [Diversispora epigaea]|uniref:Uncharacterized protein n=1 Tax=Diversispora epigaea TaxID=1348612 RepID=A0A397HJY9_9GLOM|nr:hypothetical protein Glove_330g50 [Diversispora epigaea]